jgi:predicted TIM-barrel fold metal-dependent hydrolase
MSDQYRDWIDKNRDKHRDNEFREALIFHLRYLTLALEYLGTPAVERGRMVEPLVQYVKDLGPDLDELMAGPGGREFLRDSLDNSVFVRQMQLQNELDQLNDWETRPSNLSGIEEKTILPLLREHAPERVMSFWEFKLEREQAAAAEARLAVDAANFKNLRLPTLLWQRAEDRRNLGNPAGAYAEMLRILENYPNHPSYMSWVQTLEGYVSVPTTTGEGAN